ncbi:hypothetical protein ACTNCH_01930 [Candidatus Merdisoma sp. HCP28S3_D10]|uniref:hypothetical protein n=1 Tax=unclassified Candidatus Merdisoma TaxID=3099611 RepID=UPI003F8C3F63
MNEYQDTYEKEISLMDLLFYCLKKWRWIVAAMLVTAVLAGAYKYQATVKENTVKKEAAAELEKDGKTAEKQKKEVVTNPNIEYYERSIENTRKNLDNVRDYLDTSVLMQMDAYHLNTGVLSFYIQADNMSNSMLGNLMSAYKSFTEEGSLAETLLKTDKTFDQSEMQYLIRFESEDTFSMEQSISEELTSSLYVAGMGRQQPRVFRVEITADTEKHVEAYTEAARQALYDYSEKLKEKMGEHTLELLSETQTERIDQEIQDYQTSILNTYNNLFSNLKTMQSDLKTIKDQEGETIVVGEEVTYENPVKDGVKYAVIGLVLGAFLAAFVLVVMYLMSGRLQGLDDFRQEFEMPLLGHVTGREGKKRPFGFVDSWLTHLEEGGYADITYEERVKIAASNVKTAAREAGVTKLMLAGTIAREEAEAFRAEFVRELGELTLSDYERIVFQAAALDEIGNYEGVIFLEKQGVSYSKLIKKERAMAADRGVRVLGTVVL